MRFVSTYSHRLYAWIGFVGEFFDDCVRVANDANQIVRLQLARTEQTSAGQKERRPLTETSLENDRLRRPRSHVRIVLLRETQNLNHVRNQVGSSQRQLQQITLLECTLLYSDLS